MKYITSSSKCVFQKFESFRYTINWLDIFSIFTSWFSAIPNVLLLKGNGMRPSQWTNDRNCEAMSNIKNVIIFCGNAKKNLQSHYFTSICIHDSTKTALIRVFCKSHYGRDHSLSTIAKFSEKLTFPTPWYAHVRVRIRG